MTRPSPILITGAGGEIGSVSRTILGGRYAEVTDTLERLMGRPPMTVREALSTSLQRRQKGDAPHGG